MKNLFFMLAFVLVGTFAFANTELTSEINIDVTKAEKAQIQDNFDFSIEIQSVNDLSFSNDIQVQNSIDEDGRCRWRVCTYRNGTLVGCTAWTYGECLDEVVITANP
jgi:hypothetical protein